MYAKAFKSEFLGTIVMIGLTFTPGKYVGEGSILAEWTFHFLGVIVADRSCGGPHVNPAVTAAMLSLGKVGLDEALVNVAAQLTGGYFAFHLFR